MEDVKKPLTDCGDISHAKQTVSKRRFIVLLVSSLVLAVVGSLLLVTWLTQLPYSLSGTTAVAHAVSSHPKCAHQKSTFPESWLKFFHISDPHVDPEYLSTISRYTYCRTANDSVPAEFESSYGRYGCDSPDPLVESALHAIKNLSKTERPDFIIITGDNAAHDLGTRNGEEVLKAITISTEDVSRMFPDTYVFPCLGNNDLPEDYPSIPTRVVQYKELIKLWKHFVICEDCYWRFEEPPVVEKEFLETFTFGGFYKAQLAPKLTLLVLNTGYFSVKASVQNKVFLKTAKQQLMWLKRELKKVDDNDGKVIIAGHVPPGIDTFSQTPYWYPTTQSNTCT